MLKVLQAGRAIAAVAVAAFHLSITMALTRYGGVGIFHEYTKHGDLGVTFFFVLSGFIILFAHEKDLGYPNAWGNYIYRRFARLYPIYWIYLGVFLIFLSLGGGTDAKMPSLFQDWLTIFTLIRFNNAFLPLAPAWTLFHELAFYLIFSILILNRFAGYFSILVWSLICLFFYHYPVASERTALNVYTSAYELFFILGIFSFWLYRRGGKGIIESVAGFLVLILALLTIPLPYAISEVIIGVGFALIVAGATKLEVSYKFHVPNLLIYLGNASYTIYLTHIALEGLFLKIAIKTGIYKNIGAELTFCCVISLTLLGGCVLYSYIERPILFWLRHRKIAKNLNALKISATL